jgi:hypothetical protein
MVNKTLTAIVAVGTSLLMLGGIALGIAVRWLGGQP